MANRATVEPILIKERRIVTPRETRTALRGMFQPGVTWIRLAHTDQNGPQNRNWFLTYDNDPEKGSPPSRAKDHNCLEAVATSLMVQAVSVTMRIVTMAYVAARLLVVL